MRVEEKIVHGNHIGNNGYMYCFCKSESNTYVAHIHDCYEFIYITEGFCLYTIEGKGYFVMSGDLIFTRPGELHSFSFPDECVFSRHFLHIYPEYIASIPILKEFYESYNGSLLIPSYFVERYSLDKIYETLKEYSDTTKPETPIIAYSCAVQLMARVMKLVRDEDISEQRMCANENVHKIMQYVDQHFRSKITLDKVSETFGLSKYHISHEFKKNIRMTLTAYINMKRITLAKNLILGGEKSKDVFQKCGFNEYSTFYRAFLNFVGMSPDEFKKKMA